MKKNIWTAVLVIITMAVFAFVLGNKNQQIAQLKKELASATTAAEQTKQQLADAAKERAQLEPLPANSPVDSVPTPAPARVPAAVPQASAGAETNLMAHLAGMMKNPEMKSVIQAQQKMAVDQMYGALFKNLNRPDNEIDGLKDLLLQRQLALVDVSMSALNGSDADRKQSVEQIKTLKADYEKKIEDMLGPQDYEVFKQYDETTPERVQLQMFKGSLSADAALTDQQETDLLTAMYDERKTLPPSSLMNNKSTDPSQFTEERIAEALKELEQLQQRYAERAAAILTPAQLEQFTKWQQQVSAMQAAGLKMAAQMYGTKNAPQ